MKKFYLLRSEDVSGTSGIGVVAEGAIFDNGMVAMTWLSELESATFFKNVQTLIKIHGHGGRTVMVVEGRKRDERRFKDCCEAVRAKKRNEEKEGE